MKKVYRFTASWCGPCKMLKMYLDDVKTDVPIEVIDIDESQELATMYGIRGVPTLLMVNEQGYEIKRLSGVHMAKILEDWIND